MRHFFYTTLFLFLAVALFAAPGPNGRFVYHTVEKGETLYSISHMYGLKPQDVAVYNNGIGDKLTIKIGQQIKIPSNIDDAAVPAAAEPSSQTTVPENYHIIKKGETVFSIAKMHNMSRSDLLAWNKIKDNNISVGQKLLVAASDENVTAAVSAKPSVSKSEAETAMRRDGYTWTLPSKDNNVSTASADITASTSGAGMGDAKPAKAWKEESTSGIRDYYKGKSNTYDPSSEYETLYYQNIYSGMVKKSETGVAKFLGDNNSANTAYYNNAPIGTILKLTNADNGKTTYAIVVGKIPAAEENSYLLKLSGKVARNLAAKDYSSIQILCYTEN